VPRKSGHTSNSDLTIVYHGGRCPDLSGPAGALRRWHETKKDIPMLFLHSFLGSAKKVYSVMRTLMASPASIKAKASCISSKANLWVTMDSSAIRLSSTKSNASLNSSGL
jgi:hypothetical protein